MAAVASEGQRSTLPDARGYADRVPTIGVKAVRQAGINRLGQRQKAT